MVYICPNVYTTAYNRNWVNMAT